MSILLSGLVGLLLGSLIVILVGKYLLSRQENMFHKEIAEYKRTHTIDGQWAGDYAPSE